MSRLPVDIRRASTEDLDDILRMWEHGQDEVTRTGRTAASASSADQLRGRLAEALVSRQLEVFVARRDGRPAGLLVLREAPIGFLSETHALCIEQLYVDGEERRRGVARAMLSYAAGRAELAGCDQIVSSVMPWARDTHRFFARLGFTPLTVHRTVTPSLLRRRLAGESTRGTLDDLLSRRRSLRARARLHGRPDVTVDLLRPDLLGPVTGEHPRLA